MRIAPAALYFSEDVEDASPEEAANLEAAACAEMDTVNPEAAACAAETANPGTAACTETDTVNPEAAACAAETAGPETSVLLDFVNTVDPVMENPDYLFPPVNPAKGLFSENALMAARFSADVAAITHDHPLGYMPAAVVAYIIQRLAYRGNKELPLRDLVLEAKDALLYLFFDPENERYEARELAGLIDKALDLAANDRPDQENIAALGQGWIADEAMAISLYCALRHEHDLSGGLIAAVNHNGDSDSTGAITGNILGCICGYDAIDPKWTEMLEMTDIILQISDDLWQGCPLTPEDQHCDEGWYQRYVLKKSVLG